MTGKPIRMPVNSLPAGVVRQRALAPRNLHAWVAPDDRIEASGSGHFHWTISAFEWADEETGAIHDAVTVTVEASSEGEAVARAMAIVERPAYRVASVSEACSWDGPHDS